MKASHKGLLMVVISGIVFGIMPSTVKYCYSQGATPSLVMISRSVLFQIILIPIVLRKKNTWPIFRQTWPKYVLLALTGTGTPLLLFVAYKYLSTGMTTTIHFLYPAIVALICAVFFREKLSKGKGIALLLCFLGILLMMDTSEQMLSVTGILIAIASSITWALYIILLDRFDLKGASSEQIMFFTGISSIVLVSLFGMALGDFAVSVTPIGWLAIAASNIFISVFGSLFFIIGVKHTDAQVSAIASTLEPIASIVIGVLFLHETVSLRIGIGCVLILSAVILLAVCGDKEREASNA